MEVHMFNFEELEDSRASMFDEFNSDLTTGNEEMYGTMLTPHGRVQYVDRMKEAILHGHERSIVAAMVDQPFWKPRDGRGAVWTPENCSKRFCETEFNHYYMRGLLVRVLRDGQLEVLVYRAA